jgi:hypothetical protein
MRRVAYYYPYAVLGLTAQPELFNEVTAELRRTQHEVTQLYTLSGRRFRHKSARFVIWIGSDVGG